MSTTTTTTTTTTTAAPAPVAAVLRRHAAIAAGANTTDPRWLVDLEAETSALIAEAMGGVRPPDSYLPTLAGICQAFPAILHSTSFRAIRIALKKGHVRTKLLEARLHLGAGHPAENVHFSPSHIRDGAEWISAFTARKGGRTVSVTAGGSFFSFGTDD